MNELFSTLNESQKQAVLYNEGPLLVVAGPGSGKTRVITHKISYLISEKTIHPHQILAVTFTNKAAKEISSRVKSMNANINPIHMGTFHSICNRILRKHSSLLGYHNYSIYDEADQFDVLKQVLTSNHINPQSISKRSIISAISKAKISLHNPETFMSNAQDEFQELTARLFKEYQKILEENNAMDFDDLLKLTIELFENNPEILKTYQNQYMHILVDEFQDTNIPQYRITQLLTDKHKNICVVGDPDQSIYSWRDADIKNILNFEKDFPGTKKITLENNYRSSGTIIDAAKQLIASNSLRIAKEIKPIKELGEKIVVHETYDEREEAMLITSITKTLSEKLFIPPTEIAIMYRTNSQSRVLEEACIRNNINYTIVGGIKFYQRKEIKDILCYLRVIANNKDNISLSRIINLPPRGFGEKSIQIITEYAYKNSLSFYETITKLGDEKNSNELSSLQRKTIQNLSNLLNEISNLTKIETLSDLINIITSKINYRDFLMDQYSNFEERWDNILELQTLAEEFENYPIEESLHLFLNHASLVTDDNINHSPDSAITLTTLHQGKGLEFQAVFITGLEEGLLPHFRSLDDPSSMEEERRLCYVGITRAKDYLYLSRAFKRTLSGKTNPTIPSRFLKEIFSTGANFNQKPPEIHRKTKINPIIKPHKSKFRTGDKVHHNIFGNGIVLYTKLINTDVEITVAFKKPAGIKKLAESFSKLQKLTKN